MGLWDFAAAIVGADGANKDRKYQKQFAQSGIQWRVADAEKAGVHPLYALGAQVTPYQSVGDGGVGDALRSHGQDVSRARMATMDRKERMAELHAAQTRQALQDRMSAESHAQDMEHGSLENDLLRSQLSRMNSAQIPPALPDGSGRIPDSRRVQPQVSRPMVSAPNDPRRQAGTISDYQYVRTGPRSVGIVPSEDIANRFDEIPGQGIGWWWRNNALPFFGSNVPRPPPASEFPAPQGYRWVWNGTAFHLRRVGSDGTVSPWWDRE